LQAQVAERLGNHSPANVGIASFNGADGVHQTFPPPAFHDRLVASECLGIHPPLDGGQEHDGAARFDCCEIGHENLMAQEAA
jgi:hypothetical protein